MDIDLLSKMVKELILDNDRVVLPGLGSFVAEIVPSTFSDKGYTINPPYRKLYFRAKPDEGMELARFYADSNNVDFAVAERIIKDFIAELKPVLHTRKIVIFPGLGRLRATKENNLFFVADEDLDIYPDGFALEPVSLKTHHESREEVVAVVEDLKLILEEPKAPQKPVAEPGPVAEPESDTDPEPATEPEPTAEPESVAEPESETVEENLSSEAAAAPKKGGFVKALIVILAVIFLLMVAFAVVGRLAPDFVDGFLYTPEELKILNYKL